MRRNLMKTWDSSVLMWCGQAQVALGGCEGGSRQEYAIYGIKDGGWCILTRAGEPKKEIPGMLNERLRRMPAGEEDHESTYQAGVGLHNAYGLDGLTAA